MVIVIVIVIVIVSVIENCNSHSVVVDGPAHRISATEPSVRGASAASSGQPRSGKMYIYIYIYIYMYIHTCINQ